MKVRQLGLAEAQNRLSEINLQIGQWGQMETLDSKGLGNHAGPFQAPRDSLQLFNFSQHVAEWLPISNWLMLKFDHSNSLDRSEFSLIEQLCFGASFEERLEEGAAILFEFDSSLPTKRQTSLLIANLIFAIGLLEGHAQLASSDGKCAHLLSMQDGFAYFASDATGIDQAEKITKSFVASPLASPEWVNALDWENLS